MNEQDAETLLREFRARYRVSVGWQIDRGRDEWVAATPLEAEQLRAAAQRIAKGA